MHHNLGHSNVQCFKKELINTLSALYFNFSLHLPILTNTALNYKFCLPAASFLELDLSWSALFSIFFRIPFNGKLPFLDDEELLWSRSPAAAASEVKEAADILPISMTSRVSLDGRLRLPEPVCSSDTQGHNLK
jgi:hypothetical protein